MAPVPPLMTPERGLWACAQNYVARFGDDAWRQAGVRMRDLLLEGDEAGCRRWMAIQDRIVQLRKGPVDTTTWQ